MSEPTEKDILEKSRQLLQSSERALDELTVARLRAARLKAIDAKPHHLLTWRFVGGAVATGLALGLAGVLWFRTPAELHTPPIDETAAADLELLATENPEFYNDLEFYRWLASQPDAG